MFIFLPDSPVTAKGLSLREKRVAVARLQKNQTGVENKHLKVSFFCCSYPILPQPPFFFHRKLSPSNPPFPPSFSPTKSAKPSSTSNSTSSSSSG